MDLSNGIPLHEAAAFFLRLKGAAALPGDAELIAQARKTAGAVAAAPPPLPPTATGQNTVPSTTPPPLPPAALGQHKTARAAALFKRVLDEAGLAPAAASAGAPPPADYVAREQAGLGAEEQNVAGFYQQKMQQALAELAAAEQRAQASEEQVAALDQQVQQGEMLRQQYQQMVSSATQQSVESQDQVLREQQGAAALRMAYQQLRGQLLNVATQEPPTTQALQDQAAIAASQQAAAAPGPTPLQGPAGQAPTPGTPPGSPPSEGGESDAAPSGGSGGKNAGTQPASQKGIKEAGAIDAVRGHLPHAAVGAGLGALSELGYAARSNAPLREKVQRLESQDRTLGSALDLAQAKARLALGELVEQHPTAALLSGAAAGALAGGAHGPAIAGDLRAGLDNLRRMKAIA